MIFSESQIEALKKRVSSVLSKRRFTHTLGVESAVIRLGNVFCPDAVSELRCAALLHDVTKELPAEAAEKILHDEGYTGDPDLMKMPAVFHSLTAPAYIREHFGEYATDNILSAVLHHTVGAPYMSLFDKIVFIADYVEENRTYPASVSTRSALFSGLSSSDTDPTEVLNRAILSCLDATILSLTASDRPICAETVKTRNAILTELSQE